MNRESYANALEIALTEIKKAYPGIHHSFLFTNTGLLVSKDSETDQETVDNVIESFEELYEKAEVIGGLKNVSATSTNGKLIISSIDEMYLVLATSDKVNENKIFSIKDVILPIILKTVEQTCSANHQTSFETEKKENEEEMEEDIEDEPEEEVSPEKELIVDILSGFFAGDSVKVDAETLMEWTNEASSKGKTKVPINHVRVETFAGNSTLCKVKEISDGRMKNRNKIRIPEKICIDLELRKGDKVKVKPLI